MLVNLSFKSFHIYFLPNSLLLAPSFNQKHRLVAFYAYQVQIMVQGRSSSRCLRVLRASRLGTLSHRDCRFLFFATCLLAVSPVVHFDTESSRKSSHVHNVERLFALPWGVTRGMCKLLLSLGWFVSLLLPSHRRSPTASNLKETFKVAFRLVTARESERV